MEIEEENKKEQKVENDESEEEKSENEDSDVDMEDDGLCEAAKEAKKIYQQSNTFRNDSNSQKFEKGIKQAMKFGDKWLLCKKHDSQKHLFL